MVLIDGLRAAAAVAVVVAHLYPIFRDAAARPGVMYTIVYSVGAYLTLGVQVFFVLSGFVIAYSLRDARVTPRFFARFAVRRSIRLDPPYWAALAFCCGCLWVAGRLWPDLAPPLPGPAVVLAHAAYLQGFLGCGNAINHAYWTLCIEVQLYLAFCGGIGLLQAARVPPAPALTAAFVVAVGSPLGVVSVPDVPGLFVGSAYGFLAGAVGWWTVSGGIPRWAGVATLGGAAAVACRHGDVQVWVVTGTAGLLAVAAARGDLYRWLAHRPVQWVGRTSYAIYLVHNPIILLAWLGQKRLKMTSVPADLAVAAVVLVATFAAAWALHVTVERPCLDWAGRLRGPAAAGGAADVPLVPG